jgi:guanylate kinase
MSVLLVIAGPSGVGKGTIVRRLLERDPSIWVSTSATTRPPRAGEVDGREYWFLDPEEFQRRVDAGGFLEAFDVFDARYGTPRGPVEAHLAAGDDVLAEVDVQGALAIRAALPQALLVFIRPPSREVLRRRLHDRDPAADSAALERRLDEADAEEARAAAFDAVVVNDDLERAVAEVRALLDGRRRGSDPQAPIAEGGC